MRNPRGTALPVIIIIIALILVGSIGALLTIRNWTDSNANTPQCTLEAKLCPDGSSVGRTGPNCEFAACPITNTNMVTNTNSPTTANSSTVPVNWKTYTNDTNGFSVRFPPHWQEISVEDGCLLIGEDGRTCTQTVPIVSFGDAEWREDQPEGGTSLAIHFSGMSSGEFIQAYNADGDSASQITKPTASETFMGLPVTHVTAATAIGLDSEYLFFADSAAHPFFVEYKAFDNLQTQILSTFTFLQE